MQTRGWVYAFTILRTDASLVGLLFIQLPCFTWGGEIVSDLFIDPNLLPFSAVSFFTPVI